MDVNKFKCVFLQHLALYLEKKKWGAACEVSDLLKTFSAYLFLLDSSCDLGEDILKKIQDFYNTYVLPGSSTAVSTQVITCNITLTGAKADIVNCPVITITVT